MMDYGKIIDYCRKYNTTSLLDIGCHVGEFSFLLNKHLKFDKILCIDLNERVKPLIEAAGFKFINCVLGDCLKTVEVFYDKDNLMSTGNSIFRENTRHFEEPVTEWKTCYPMDLLIVDDYDLIKMDVQGSEYDIIVGGEETVKAAKIVILETQLKEYNLGAPLQEEVINLMTTFGFNLVDKVGTGIINDEIYQEDLLFVNKNEQ